MNTGGDFSTPEFTVKSVSAIHSSSFDDGAYGGNSGGFVITSDEGNLYYAGDTALTNDMKQIGEGETLRFAFLPVGDNYTMGYQDAIKASDYIRCNNIIGMHYNTFDLIKIDCDKVSVDFGKAGKMITFLAIGETREF